MFRQHRSTTILTNLLGCAFNHAVTFTNGAMLDFTTCGKFKTLFCATFCFQFGHFSLHYINPKNGFCVCLRKGGSPENAPLFACLNKQRHVLIGENMLARKVFFAVSADKAGMLRTALISLYSKPIKTDNRMAVTNYTRKCL
jgi:hypothetical protein